MSAQDQLEIINTQGEIRFHPLQPGRGITNIGRHPDNDIIIDSPDIAPFHAILDHQQKPYRIIALNLDSKIKVSGELLQPNKPRELRNWDTIELDGYSIILMEGGATASPAAAPSILPTPLPTPTPPPPEAAPVAASPGEGGLVSSGGAATGLSELEMLEQLLASIPEDRVDDLIIVEPLAQNGAIDPSHPGSLDFSMEVEQPATMQVTIANGGDLVGEFNVEVRGLDPGWVTVSPKSINLNEGERGSVGIAIKAPRLPSSRAKAYYFSVVVTSPTYPGRMSSTTGLFLIKPFYEFAVGDVDPKKQSISYSKRQGKAIIPIISQGNADASFQLVGEDDRHASNIEFDSPEEGLKLHGQLQVKVPPESTLPIALYVTPRNRKLVGFGGQDIPYTITVTPLDGGQTPRSVLGQARSLPLIGPIPIVLLALLLALLVILIFRPWIGEFKSDKAEIESGESVTLNWRASPFAALHLEPGVGKVEGPDGSITLQPPENVTYTLRAENLLTSLSAQWFGASAELPIVVDPVLPKVKFSVDRESILSGEAVTVSWEIERADEVILTVNGAPDTILPAEYIGSRQFVLDRDTTFSLKVVNRYTPPDGVTDSKTVTVTTPTPTPLPLPIIQRFDVTPLTITAGQSVTVSWAVTGAKSVTIEGVGDVPDSGSISVKPDASTAYTLKASNGEASVSSPLQQVIVNPAPTPTPLPGAPKIEFFIASPSEVAIGSPESKNIVLSWSITGDTTNVELSGPTFGKATGLPAKGSQKVSADKQTLFILTAFNGTLSTSSTVQVKVKNPAPKVTSINPSSSTDVGGSGFALVVSGSGFTKDSKVRWEGSNRATTFVNDTQLTAIILPDDIAKAGTFNVSVFNPTPGGGASGAVVFTLNNPVPSISSINPISVVRGSPGLILTVNGSNFINSVSVVRFGGVDMATTFVNSTQLTAVIPAGQLGTAGQPAVTVVNPPPGGGTSNTATFQIFASNPQPFVNDLTATPPGLVPNTVVAGGLGFPLTVNGTDFISGSLVRWNGTFLTTTVVNSTQLTASVPLTSIASPTTAKITVFNPTPGGGISTPQRDFTVAGPTLSLSPAPTPPATSLSVLVGSLTRMTVTISGGPQAAARTISLSANSSAIRFTSFVSGSCTSTAITTVSTVGPDFNTADFCVQGLTKTSSVTMTALLPSVLGSGTATANFIVNNPSPTISSLNPPTISAGSPTFVLTINGTGFATDAVATWNGSPRPYAFVSSSQMLMLVWYFDVTTSGTATVAVTNGSPCAGSCSASSTFTIGNRLTVNVSLVGTSAAGTVTSSGSMNCTSGTCIEDFATGTTVTLTASPGANTVFTGWTPAVGTCTGTASPCTVTMSTNQTLTATFTRQWPLTVTRIGPGTVTSSPAGINCGATCSANFNHNQIVTLTASAGVFAGWSGDCTVNPSNPNECQTTMLAARSVTATFIQQNQLSVTMTLNGIATGTVVSTPTGINCTSGTCTANFNDGQNVTLQPTAGPNTAFIGWSGCGTVSGTDCIVTMSAAQSVTATFAGWTLNVNRAGTGSGTVTSNPAGINCGGDCSEDYANGTSVTLTASPASGSVFAGWSGGGCSGTGSCVVTMTSNVTVTATFTLNTLTVSKTGTGSGTVTSNPAGINCGGTCSFNFNSGQSVTLTATPSSGSIFAGWSGGGCSGTGTCTVTMNGPLTVTATFTLNTLTVSKTGTGSGTVTSNPAGINCGGACSFNFNSGQSVTLTATPSSGSVFTGWSGGGCSGTGTCTVTMNGPLTVTANFTLNTLTVTRTGTGTVTSAPAGINCGGTCSFNFDSGQSVVLTASTSGTFVGWSGGGCSGTGTCTVTMNGPLTVTATFNP